MYSNAAGFAYNNSTTELLRATLLSFSEEGEFTNDADKVLSLGTGGERTPPRAVWRAVCAERSLTPPRPIPLRRYPNHCQKHFTRRRT